jgi:hypothetical protein
LFSGTNGTHVKIFVLSKTVYVFAIGVSSSTREGVGLAEQVPRLLRPN